MNTPLYRKLASLVGARRNCEASGNTEWFDKHTENIESLVKEHFPHGSGFDAGTTIDLDASTEEKLVFDTSFHHMNEAGYYDGWSEHRITVTPSLMFGFQLRISGTDRNAIKEYMHDEFNAALNTELVKV